MKFTIQDNFEDSTESLMRRISYHFLGRVAVDEEMNFARPLTQNRYPRFHIYLKKDQNKKTFVFNLHLDQKKPSYKGSHAHSGEYEGFTVEQEAERIKRILTA